MLGKGKSLSKSNAIGGLRNDMKKKGSPVWVENRYFLMKEVPI